MLKVAQIISRKIQNIATMATEESSGFQQLADQLLIILGMFGRINCDHQNQFIIMFSQNILFQVSDFLKKMILRLSINN